MVKFDSRKKMDSNFRNAVESLSGNAVTGLEGQIDIIQLELNQRKFELELITKRKQVDQLRQEVDIQNEVVQELTRNLELANEKIASLESENVILKTYSDGMQVHANCQSIINKKIMEKENVTLKELLQKAEMEKRKLQREREDLLTQQTVHAVNIKELLEQDQKIRNTIEKYSKAFDEIDKEKSKLVELHNKLGELQKCDHQIELLHDKLKISTLENRKLEDDLTFSKAKLGMMEEVLQNYSLPQSNKPTKFEEYYIEKAEDLERHLTVERELLFKQQERLSKEVNANAFLCNKIADLEKQVEDLEKKQSRINNQQAGDLCE